MTDEFTKSQLNSILSALDGKQRNPNTKDAALKAIARHGERLGLSVKAILHAGAGLLDGRFSAEEFVAEISEPAAAQMETSTKEPATPKPRANTKQALMIEILRRPEGATVEQIAEATGWKNHTIRGAIAGALKKKLGLTITTERVRSVGPNKEGARGSYTIYRVAGDNEIAPETSKQRLPEEARQ